MFKKIKKLYNYPFNVPKNGLYSISIEASCKSGKMLGIFGGEDLKVEIDDKKFREIPAKGRVRSFNIPPAWNGTKLEGSSKRVIFILKLIRNNHSLKFVPKKGAIITKKPHIQPLKSNKVLEYIQSQERNRQPWITIALIDLPLKTLDVSVACEKRKRDSDDVKLIIDNKIQKNKKLAWWGKNWYWRGAELQGKTKEARFYPNFSKGIHYIEFWADRMPIINSVWMNIGKAQKDKEETKRVPTVNNPEWTGDFNDDTEQMLLARTIFGEARSISKKAKAAVGWCVRNRVEDKYKRWGNTYHQVILKPRQYSAFNKTDPSRPFVENPFIDKSSLNKKRWYESYEMAGQVIRGEINDPAGGANHYYSDFIGAPKWTKSKEAQFKIKIDNTYFYYLGPERKKKILRVIIPFTIFLLLNGGIIKWLDSQNFNLRWIAARKPEAYKYEIVNNDIVQINNINHSSIWITRDGLHKSHLILSPDKLKLGYYHSIYMDNEIVDIDDEEEIKNHYDNYIALKVIELKSNTTKEIYRGNYRTSYWEWLNNDDVIAYKSCGTECMVGYVINVNTGEQGPGLQYGVGHEWSPNKETVLAYHYSVGPGITVGDKFGNILFRSIRGDIGGGGLRDMTKAVWSPDSNKIALVIKKENEEKLEFLVLDVKNDFKQIIQSDIDRFKEITLSWNGNEKIIFNNQEFIL